MIDVADLTIPPHADPPGAPDRLLEGERGSVWRPDRRDGAAPDHLADLGLHTGAVFAEP